MMAPCRRSSTGILLWMAANMVDPPDGAPPLRQAFSLTRYSSVNLTSPCLMAWKTNSAVISFIMLEGARNSSAFFSNSTLPLEASIRIAVGASPSNPPSSFLAPCALLRSEEHTSELQSQFHLVCRLLLEKKKKKNKNVSTLKKKKKKKTKK